LEFEHKQVVEWLVEWIFTLVIEIWELANLSSFEVTVAKCLSNQLTKEKLDLNNKTRF
jgi:hypothetical protein